MFWRRTESNFDEYRAKLSIGLITSKFSVEAPVIKDKLSVFLAGRSKNKVWVDCTIEEMKMMGIVMAEKEEVAVIIVFLPRKKVGWIWMVKWCIK